MSKQSLTQHISEALAGFVGIEATSNVSTTSTSFVQKDTTIKAASYNSVSRREVTVKGGYPFKVLDSDPENGLYLLHYDDATIGSSTNENLRQLRGTIVDVNSGIVCSSFGYTPTIISDQIKPDTDGNWKCTDTDGHSHNLSIHNSFFQCLYEGCLMRVWKHNGKVYHSTHRRLMADHSRWGNSEDFTTLYRKYGGPEDDELFDPEKRYSSLCHFFLIVDRHLMMSSKLPLGESEGFMLYFGALPQYSKVYPGSGEAFDEEKGLPVTKFPNDQVEWDTSNSVWYNSEAFVSIEERLGSNPIVAPDETINGKVQIPCQFSVEMANQVLGFGFHPNRQSKPSDPRLSTGEAVLCRYTDNLGVLRMVKIHSNAHEWRQQVVNNQPNLAFRAYELLAESYYPKRVTDPDTYLRKFPAIGAPSVEEFRSLSELAVENRYTFVPSTTKQSNRDPPIRPISSQALVDRKNADSRDLRFRNAILCYGLSVPLARQGDVFNLYNKVTSDRQLYLTFVCQNIDAISRGKYKEQVPERYHPAWDRIQGIIAAAKDFADVRRKRGESGRVQPMIMDNIRNLIMKEGGISLYRLISAYNYYVENKNNPLYN
jgi:hypothetical protein